MLDFRSEVHPCLLVTLSFIGFVNSQLFKCLPNITFVNFYEGDCIYLCNAHASQAVQHLYCKSDLRTAVPCQNATSLDCVHLSCRSQGTPGCEEQSYALKKVLFVRRSQSPSPSPPTHHTDKPTYQTKQPDIGREPTRSPNIPYRAFSVPDGSNTYIYGILSFFFGVIAFFVITLGLRFLYKRYHMNRSSDHQLSPGGLHVQPFLNITPSAPAYNNESLRVHSEREISNLDQFEQGAFNLAQFERRSLGQPERGTAHSLDLPPSYVVASELLDPPPSYEDVSKSTDYSTQKKFTAF